MAGLELRAVAQRYRELRIEREGGQSDVAQRRSSAVCFVSERYAQPHSPHFCGLVPRVSERLYLLTDPKNDRHLVTRLEIVLTREGRLKKMGIVKTSGITAFDIAALDAVDRAQPFGPAPTAIVSPDGNVYLHWEFHRDEVFACSTAGARPFVLSNPGAPKNE